MRVRKILYPTDFSPCAEQAFAYAASLARRFGAELHVFHAANLHAQEPYEPAFHVPAADEARAEALQTVADGLAAYAANPLAEGLRVVQTSRHDVVPGPAIVDYAEEQDIDVIVMATHGRRNVSRLLLGSVTEAVVRRAGCPVLTLRGSDAPAPPRLPLLRSVMVPFDFSPPARAAFADASDLARHYGARLMLLHVIEEPRWREVYGFRGFSELAQQREKLMLDVDRRLRGIAEALAPGVPCEIEVRVGRPAAEILAAATRADVDLVVMASRGLTGVRRLIFGSTAEEVVRLADTPIMVVKPQDGVLPEPITDAEVVEAQIL